MPPLTVRAAAGRLGVGYSTLKHWIHDGHVRTTQTPGGHHRIDEAERVARQALRCDERSVPNMIALANASMRRGRYELADAILGEAKVAFVPGEAFGTPGYARFSFAMVSVAMPRRRRPIVLRS